MRPKTYQDNFFNYHLEDSINSAKEVIPIVLKYIKPASVIDVGCGVGTWLSVWKQQGITDIQGVDGEYVNLKELLIEPDKFIKQTARTIW
jgi:2-polyprenyl-3-methyl-5-hydroxy-6-metoxy-1,4-benzoquinol methylase